MTKVLVIILGLNGNNISTHFCPVFIIVDYEWNVDKNDDSELNSQTNDRNKFR
jgi:hypothetical protein